MPVIRLNDATFADLASLSTWYGAKTPGDAIDRLVREAMAQLGLERDVEAEVDSVAIRDENDVLKFDKTPSLSFTKVRGFRVGRLRWDNGNWSTILLRMVDELQRKGFDSEKLVAELKVPARFGLYELEGYKFYPHLGISIQGQSASDAWKEVERIASKWGISVSVAFEWRDNPKAQFPGRKGKIGAGTK